MKMEVMTTATTWRITMREMIDLNLITLLLLGDEVSDSANGMNLDPGASLRKLLAQTVDVHLDRVRCDFSRVSEDVIFNLFLGNHAALAAHQQFEHRGFACRQDLGLVVDGRLPVSCIEFEIGDAQRASKQIAGPSQLSFQPRDQFLQRERLHQVVVGSAAQAEHAIMKTATRGKHQNWDRVVLMAQLAQECQA